MLLAASATFGMTRVLAKPADPLELWSGIVPGEQKILPTEQDTTKSTDGLIAGKSVIRLGNVSRPTLQVFRPPADQDSGTAVLVFPGGGYHILAMDLEGTEICEWLNSIGVTGVLVKYRVPKRPGQAENLAPFQDAQRALGVVRWRAKEWGLNPQRLGVLGFSAGGHLAARLSNNYGERAYPTVDDGDRMSCRPDFSVLVYPGGLTEKDHGDALRPEMSVTAGTAPTFMVIAQDDPVRVENALQYAIALQAAKVPMELHVYPTGGHGYGLRRTAENVTSWSDRAADWMRGRGLLARERK